MPEIDPLRLIDPHCYAEHGYPHEAWKHLRQESPIRFFEPPGWPSFWAVTKHADIVEISKQPDHFLNAPGMTLVRDHGRNQEQQQQKDRLFETNRQICEQDRLLF